MCSMWFKGFFCGLPTLFIIGSLFQFGKQKSASTIILIRLVCYFELNYFFSGAAGAAGAVCGAENGAAGACCGSS